MKNINKAITFAKKETVLIVAMLLAVISAFFVTPDKAYASYIDFRTLGLLFSLMTVTEGCKGLGIFERSAKFIISKVNTAFQLSIVLVGLCFFSSMFITNDVSLLTFVPSLSPPSQLSVNQATSFSYPSSFCRPLPQILAVCSRL